MRKKLNKTQLDPLRIDPWAGHIKYKKKLSTFDRIVNKAIESNPRSMAAADEIYKVYRKHMTVKNSKFEQYDEQEFDTWLDQMILAQKKVPNLVAYVEKLSGKNITETERMRNILNICEGLNDVRHARRKGVVEIYYSVLNNYKLNYFEAMQADKILPRHIKASKRHTGNVVDQAVSDLVNQVAYEYSVDAQTAEDIAFDSTLEIANDEAGNLHVTNLYIMMDDDLRKATEKSMKDSNDMLGRLFK